jgi:hypothetical protein
MNKAYTIFIKKIAQSKLSAFSLPIVHGPVQILLIQTADLLISPDIN